MIDPTKIKIAFNDPRIPLTRPVEVLTMLTIAEIKLRAESTIQTIAQI
ncbi:hypothetical protein [Mycoplasma sp. ATU-Cv-508]